MLRSRLNAFNPSLNSWPPPHTLCAPTPISPATRITASPNPNRILPHHTQVGSRLVLAAGRDSPRSAEPALGIHYTVPEVRAASEHDRIDLRGAL